MEPLARELINNCEKKEMILSAREVLTGSLMKEAGDIGIVSEGALFLESMDENGVRRILDLYKEGDMFKRSEFTFCQSTDYYIYAKTKSKVAFFSYQKMIEFVCEKEMTAQFNEYLEERLKRRLSHIHILEQHGLRQKIAAFFENESDRANRNPFELRMSLTDCADYIAVDRSAMMREIKNMEMDGLIEKHGKRIKLLYI